MMFRVAPFKCLNYKFIFEMDGVSMNLCGMRSWVMHVVSMGDAHRYGIRPFQGGG
jgi:hypothetical protein